MLSKLKLRLSLTFWNEALKRPPGVVTPGGMPNDRPEETVITRVAHDPSGSAILAQPMS